MDIVGYQFIGEQERWAGIAGTIIGWLTTPLNLELVGKRRPLLCRDCLRGSAVVRAESFISDCRPERAFRDSYAPI